ncbi:hypothetical protein [Ruoffia tabacinasalis]|uniref:hypothetical protein n=1 Tax=Ruoffia tabacinasalis TaxID=87458 RepID=UPI0030D4BB55
MLLTYSCSKSAKVVVNLAFEAEIAESRVVAAVEIALSRVVTAALRSLVAVVNADSATANASRNCA